MAEEDAQISSILERSKLQSVNTYVALMTLVNQVCVILKARRGHKLGRAHQVLDWCAAALMPMILCLLPSSKLLLASKMEISHQCDKAICPRA